MENPISIHVTMAEPVKGKGMILLGSPLQPLGTCLCVHFNTGTEEITGAQIVLRISIALISSQLKEFHSLVNISRNAYSFLAQLS